MYIFMLDFWVVEAENPHAVLLTYTACCALCFSFACKLLLNHFFVVHAASAEASTTTTAVFYTILKKDLSMTWMCKNLSLLDLDVMVMVVDCPYCQMVFPYPIAGTAQKEVMQANN